MGDIDRKLRAGMEKKGITEETQNKIVQAITSFALYDFPSRMQRVLRCLLMRARI